MQESVRKQVEIPFLPGNSFGNPRKTSFAKTHTLGYKNGLPIAKIEYTGIGGEMEHSVLQRVDEAELAETSRDWIMSWKAREAPAPSEYVPSFVACDKLVLAFTGFFKETVHESAQETFRVRPVVFQYYVEDDTICILEPRQPNSGLPQGVFLRRHRVPKDERNVAAGFFTLDDLSVGAELRIYGIVYRLVDANGSTREYISKNCGRELAPAEAIPQDPYRQFRERLEKKSPTHPAEHDASLRQFLKYDRQVLRFFCTWDDRAHMFGERRDFVLHYFLSSDEIEVIEAKKPNSGHEPFPAFVRRCKVPKAGAPVQFYSDADLRLGESVCIFGRDLLIRDCDDFTKRHLASKFGITEFQPVVVEEERPPVATREIPPYLGLGSEEDSLATCFSVVPKPFKKDFAKMLKLDHQVLRFLGRLETANPNDAPRRFVISYFLADDSLAVFEPPRRNSGQLHGKLMERKRVTKPGTNIYYGLRDLQVGGVLEFYRHRFVLLDADKYTLEAMKSLPCLPPNMARIEQEFRLRLAQEKDAVIEALSRLPDPCPLPALAQALESVGLAPSPLEMEALVGKYGAAGAAPAAVTVSPVEVGAALEEASAIQAGAAAGVAEMTGALGETGASTRDLPHSMGATSAIIQRGMLREGETEEQLRARLRETRAILDRFLTKVQTRRASLTDIFREFTNKSDACLTQERFTAHCRFLGVTSPAELQILVAHFFGEKPTITFLEFVQGMHPDEKPVAFDAAVACVRS